MRCPQEEITIFAPLPDAANFCFASAPEQAGSAMIESILLFSINQHDVVGGGCTKAIAHLWITRVAARSRVAQYLFAIQPQHETKFVVVRMAPLSEDSVRDREKQNFCVLRLRDRDPGLWKDSNSLPTDLWLVHDRG